MELFEKTLSSQCLYKGRIISLYSDEVELENGAKAGREVIDHPGGVGVLPITADGDVLMVRQFRYPHRQVLLEIPAGKLDANEEPLVCGKRELEEETGFCAKEYIPLGVMYPTPGYLNETVHLYLARGLYKTHQHLDEDEFLTVERMPFAKVLQMVLEGEIEDAKTQVTILKYQVMLANGLL